MLEILQWAILVGLVVAIIILKGIVESQNKAIANLIEANENLSQVVESLTNLVRQLGGWTRRK